MNRRLLFAVLLLSPLVLDPRVLAWAQEPVITGPQQPLPTETLTIVGHDGTKHVFHVEIAKTPQQQTIGLMFRQSLPPDGGMLFEWGVPQDSQMWMRNTLIPLDMVFINKDGTIRSITENAVPRSLAIIDSNGPVVATLELPAGTAARMDLRAGDKVQGSIFTAEG